MRRVLRRLFVSLLAWEVIVACSIAFMYVLANRKSLGPEGQAFLLWAFALGFVVVLICWPVCQRLSRVRSILAGLGLGLLVPAVAGLLWGRVVDPRLYGWNHPWGLPSGLNWTGMDAWLAGLQLAVPSAVAGAIVGLLQAKDLRGTATSNT